MVVGVEPGMNIPFQATIIYFLMIQFIDDNIICLLSFFFRLTIEFVDLEAHMAQNGK